MGGRSIRRIPPHERSSALRRSWEERRQNPIANRILSIKADFIVGSGMKPESENEELRDFLADVWTDPVNRLDQRQHALAIDHRGDGELLCQPLVNGITAKTRFLWHDVAIIVEVLAHRAFPT